MDHITMSRKEINQIAVFERLKQGAISFVLAAQILNLSSRQIRNKRKRYKRYGSKGLVHRSRGKPGNRAWDEEMRIKAMEIIKTHYPDFGPTFAAEKLAEHHGIAINRETLRQAMIKAGIWRGKKRRVKQRKDRFGVIIQLDGSDHDWFEGRGPRCTLLVFIDDATSRIVWAEFVTGESLDNLLHPTYGYFQNVAF